MAMENIIEQFDNNFLKTDNNRYFGEIKSSKLLKFDIEIPGIQRIKDKDKQVQDCQRQRKTED